jgi:ABC-type nitrate/sulfonate/bicarbonate transport system permease component
VTLTATVHEGPASLSVATRLRRVLKGRRLGLALIALLLLLWEFSARSGLVVSANWPPISVVLLTAIKSFSDGELLEALAGTLYRMMAGFLLGGAAGIVIGMAMGSSAFVRRLLGPTVELLRPMPIPALIPPLVLFLGSADKMKITIVAFTVFFPVLINTIQGTLSVEPTYRGVAATFGLSWLDTVRKVLFSATLPYIFAGLRISLSLALVAAVVGEMIVGGSGAGVGLYLVAMEYAGRAAEMYVAILLIGVCGYALNRAFVMMEQAIVHWHMQEE